MHKLLYPLFLLVCLSHCGPSHGTETPPVVELYPAPEGFAASSDYTLSVNAQPSFVYSFAQAANEDLQGSFARFSFGGGPVAISITSAIDITQVEEVLIRPLALGIKPVVNPADDTIQFTLNSPAQLSIEVKGTSRPLFLFASPLENPSEVFRSGGPNVRYFGPGLHTNIGPNNELVVGSNQTVYLAGGAYVKGRIRVGSSDRQGPGTSHVKVLGRGILDATELVQSDGKSDPGRPIRINKSTDVQLKGLTILGRESWAVVANQSSDLLYERLQIINWRETKAGTPDGMDFVGSHHAQVNDVFIRSYDDAIAVKNNKFGWFGPSFAIHVERAVIWNGFAGNAIEIGWETWPKFDLAQGNFIKNLNFRDIDIIHKQARPDPNNRAALSIHNGDTASIEDIRFEGIRIEDVEENVFNLLIDDLATSECGSGPECRGHIRRVEFRNIQVEGGRRSVIPPSRFRGFDQLHTLENIYFQGLTFMDMPRTSLADPLGKGADFLVHPDIKSLQFLP